MPDGQQIARFYQGSVNYRDGNGDWQPIDDTLVPTFAAGYAYRNKANAYTAELPQNIQSPVRVSFKGESIEVNLEGAQGLGITNGPSADFTNAFTGVTARYTAANDALKETLVLQGPSAQSSFRFHVKTSDGLFARANKPGGIDFISGDEVAFSFAAPFMQDSSGTLDSLSDAVRLQLTKAADGYDVTLSADRNWLDSKQRVWPVAIDPTVTLRSDPECTISSDPSSVIAGCSHLSVLGVGKRSGSPDADRSLFRFQLTGVPADAHVDSATFGLTTYWPPQSGASLSVHPVTKDWSTTVSWVNADGATPWGQPGGDLGAPVATSQVPAGASGAYTWNLTSLVQGWLNRSITNRGMILKSSEVAGDYTEFASSLYPFGSSSWPYLQVKWTPQGSHISSPSKTWVVDDGSGDVPRVNAVKSSGKTVYLGGDFGYLGPRTGSAVSLRMAADGGGGQGTYDQSFPEVAGLAPSDPTGSEVPVRSVVADGSGGWYIGGDFKYVGGLPRQRLAHIRSNGTVDPAFAPTVDGTIYALALSGTDLYLGGSFTHVSGRARAGVAKLDTSSGAVNLTFNPPAPTGEVRAIALAQGRLYVGGTFTTFGGPGSRIAALDLTTGFPNVLWYPPSGADGTVTAIAATSTNVYVGGEFTHLGGQLRNHAGAFDSQGAVTGWDPNADGSVDSLLVSGSRIYAGGTFSNIGQSPRNAVAALDLGTAAAVSSWNANVPANTRVRTLADSGSALYVGGDFKSMGGQARRYLAALGTNGVATNWNPSMGNEVYALGLATNRVYAGGLFRSANGFVRRNLAAVDTTTGQPTSWNPNLQGGVVNALEQADGKLYVGGTFTSAGTQTRSSLASYIQASGALTSWNPAAQGVEALCAASGRLYVGASSLPSYRDSHNTTTPRHNAGAFSLQTGNVTAWDPQPDAVLTDIEAGSYELLYVAGSFHHIGPAPLGTDHDYLAAVDESFGYESGQTANPDGEVLDISVSGDTVYLAGRFTHISSLINGQWTSESHQYLAAANLTLQTLKNWGAANPDGPVEALANDSDGVYAGGRFSNIGSTARPGLAAFDPATGATLPFTPSVGISSQTTAPGSVRALEAAPERLVAGGDQYSIGTAAQTGLALFNKYGTMVEPVQGTRTSKRLRLRAKADSSVFDRVTFEYRGTDSDPWATIPAQGVTDDRNQAIGSWPKTLDATGASPTLIWQVPQDTALPDQQKKYQVRAVFTNSSGDTYPTDAANVTLDPTGRGAGDPTETIGPGGVDLVTGNFTVSRDDVSSNSYNSDLTFSRTFNSRGTSTTGALGPGWSTGLPVDAAASDFTKLEVINDEAGQLVIITTSDGSELGFVLGADGRYQPDPSLEDLSLSFDGSAFQLSDQDGNITIFESSGGSYRPARIYQPGTDNQTSYTYQGDGKISQIFAPGASNNNCTQSALTDYYKRKCRYLTLSYGTGGRIDHIEYTAWDPDSAAPTTVWMAQYEYDSQNRLSAAWDPRISPALKETYTYDSQGRLATVKPPGQKPWSINYAALPGEAATTGRLRSVARDANAGVSGVNTTTVFYNVAVGGSGAPYQLNPADVEHWGQADFATDATAIFPPDHVPQGDPPSSYTGAAIHYMDSQAREVNVAAPDGGIATTEYDAHNNAVRELTPTNRARALQPPATGSCSTADSLTRSRLFDTQRTYSSDGLEVREELGPLHRVQLPDGSPPTCARAHRTVGYDEGFVEDDALPIAGPLHLPTTETVGAQVPGQQTDVDVRTTTYGYDQDVRGQLLPVGQWFRKPVTVTSAGRTATTYYDEDTGLPSEIRMPANPAGGDAHATKTVYYTSATNAADPECGNKTEWEHLPCKTLPGAQPNTPDLPDLPVTTYAYSRDYQPTTETDKVGTTTRTTSTGYDTADRPASQSVASSEGASVPTNHTDYDETTGLATVTREDGSTRKITRTYDALGRLWKYQDADANTSQTTFDQYGRPRFVDDGKGSQTLSYDTSTGALSEILDTNVGSLTATYDLDGRIVTEGYTGNLQAQTTYDEVGAPVHLGYVKGANALLSFSAVENIHGQVLHQDGTRSNQDYSYDGLGRLTQTKDTPAGGTCTKRTYSYDADSNRSSMTRSGSCISSGTGPATSYSYDAADRLTNSEVTYDKFGRITSLPSSLAGGGTLTATYYSDDLVRTMQQENVASTYYLDPARRQSKRVTTTAVDSTTEIYHYSSDDDSPVWIDSSDPDNPWTRMVSGISGNLAAIQKSGGQVELQLSNLHGDVVATCGTDPNSTTLTYTAEVDEFGVPNQQGNSKFGWLGAKQRRTEFASGVVQMGVRGYVPQLGRFLEVDPVTGGSANAYDYANQDPVNQTDLGGTDVGCGVRVNPRLKGGRRKRISIRGAYGCSLNPSLLKLSVTVYRTRKLITGKGWHPHMDPKALLPPLERGDIYFSASRAHFSGGQNNHLSFEIGPNKACTPGAEYKVTVTANVIVNNPLPPAIGTKPLPFAGTRYETYTASAKIRC
jgi:RHS repeat-associated protein